MMHQPAIRIASDLQTIGQAIYQCFDVQDDRTPAEESIFARELASRYAQPDDQPGIGGVGLAIHSAYQTMASAADHVDAAYRLMTDSQGEASVQRYAIFSVLRVTLETACLTYWLIDPAIGPKERLTRGLKYVEYSRRLREQAIRRIGGQESLTVVGAMKDRIRRTSEYHGIDKITQRRGANNVVSIPNAVDLVEMLFRSIPGSSREAIDAADAAYRLASEPMHGNILGTLMGYRSSVPTDADQSMSYPTVDLGSVAVVADYAVFALSRAFESFFELMGWDLTQWRDTTRDARLDLSLVAEELRLASQ